ncbi:MAG TPA: hypothetical protein VF766_10745 [Pyrinomonadaceae bacterium]
MHRNLRSSLAFGLLLSIFCYVPVMASAQTDDAKTQKVKAAIAKLGTGFAARVTVRLKDKTKLKGYVLDAREDYFVLVDDETNASIDVAYSRVEQVKGKSKLNWNKITAGIFVGALIIYGLTFDGNF